MSTGNAEMHPAIQISTSEIEVFPSRDREGAATWMPCRIICCWPLPHGRGSEIFVRNRVNRFLARYMFTCCLTLLISFTAVLPLMAQDATDAAALFKDAGQLQNTGKFAEALKKWQQFVKAHPADPAIGLAYQGLATCALEAGDFEFAIDAFGIALKKLPEGESGHNLRWNLALAWQRRADQSKKADHRKQAAEALQTVLADPKSPRDRQALASYYLARAELSLGQKEEAHKRLLGLLENPPDKLILSATRLTLGSMAEDAQDWSEAAKRYADFLQHHPNDRSAGEARLGLAEAQYQLKKWNEAEKEFATLKDLKSITGVDYAYFRWAELANLRGDLAESARRVKQFLDAHPKSQYRSRGLHLAGDTLNQLADHAKAVEAWETLLRDYPAEADKADLRVRLGWALVKAGKQDRADPHFKAALDRQLSDDLRREALWGWARCADAKTKPDEAARRFAEFVKLKDYGPDGDQPLYEAVFTVLGTRDLKTAAAWTEKMVERFPKSVWTANAQMQTARHQADAGDYESATKRSRWVLDSAAKDLQAPALYIAGFSAMKSRKFKEAIGYYEKLRDEHPKSEQTPIAMFSIGVAWESLGADTKALAAYQDLVKKHPTHSLAAHASKRIQILTGQ